MYTDKTSLTSIVGGIQCFWDFTLWHAQANLAELTQTLSSGVFWGLTMQRLYLNLEAILIRQAQSHYFLEQNHAFEMVMRQIYHAIYIAML